MSCWVKFTSIDMRNNLISMLRGDVKKIEMLIDVSNYKPIPIASVSWGEELIMIDSYLLSYVLYDALLYSNDETDYRGRNISEMLDLHKQMCGEMKHPDYGKIPFVRYNDWDYFDEEDIEELKKDGASDIDIELTNEGVQHHEEKVIELLKKGASPYFLNRWNINPNCDNSDQYGYLEVAFLLCHLDSEWCNQWDLHGLSHLREEPESLDDEDLCEIVQALFDAAASQRILYLVDKYITDEAKAKGEELMREYNAYYPILRRRLC